MAPVIIQLIPIQGKDKGDYERFHLMNWQDYMENYPSFSYSLKIFAKNLHPGITPNNCVKKYSAQPAVK